MSTPGSIGDKNPTAMTLDMGVAKSRQTVNNTPSAKATRAFSTVLGQASSAAQAVMGTLGAPAIAAAIQRSSSGLTQLQQFGNIQPSMMRAQTAVNMVGPDQNLVPASAAMALNSSQATAAPQTTTAFNGPMVTPATPTAHVDSVVSALSSQAGAGTALPGMAGGGGIGVGVTASGMSNSAASGPDAVAGSLGTDNPQASLLQATREMQETQMSFSLQYLQLQEQSQQENRMFTVFSNYLKNKHEIAKNSIQNMR